MVCRISLGKRKKQCGSFFGMLHSLSFIFAVIILKLGAPKLWVRAAMYLFGCGRSDDVQYYQQ
jgi:hypothetical protein